MRQKMLFLVVVAFLFAPLVSMGQENNEAESGLSEKEEVKGIVKDKDGPLPGASISIKETTRGTVSSINGSYSIMCSKGDILVFSFIGYKTREIVVGDNKNINVTLSETEKSLKEITVVGFRGKPRSDLESPVPVDAIQATQLLKTGQVDLGQSIHFVVPSFSAQKFGINDLAPLIDPAQLRGLGSDQTLLLVNGKRRHKVSFFSGNDGVGKGQLGNDINSIPAAAIERVEVLRDGAAAQYGSDAISGVLNMRLKQNRSGGSVQASAGLTATNPTYDDITNAGNAGERIYGDSPLVDGRTVTAAANFGLPWGKEGYISTTLNFQYSSPTDRSGTYSHSTGWYTVDQLRSVYGDTRVDALDTDGDNTISNAEKTSLDQELQRQNGINLDRAILGTAENMNLGVFINAGREINDKWDFYAFGGLTRKRVVGGVFSRSPSRTERAVLGIFPDGYNPEVPSDLTDWQALVGTKAEFDGGWSVDFSLGNSGNDVQLYARNTVNPSLGTVSPTQFYTGGLNVTQTIFNADAVKSFGEMFTVAAGLEYRIETYQIFQGEVGSWRSDNTSSDVGSSGREGFTPQSAGAWNRGNIGVYLELTGDFFESLVLSAAGRYENYSDFGGDYAFKFAARYKLFFFEPLSIRASINRSFRAPALAQTHYSNFSQISFDGDGNSIVSPTLPIRDSRVQSAFGITNLKPEVSLDIAVGLTLDLLDGDLTFSLDGYRIRVDDRIFIANVAASNFTEFSTSGFDDINFFTNAINTTSLGFDFVASYKKVFSLSSILNIELALNFNQTVIDELNTTDQLKDHISFERTNNNSDFFIYLTEGTPRRKIIFTPSYRFGPVTLLARLSHFGEVSEPRLRYNSANDEWDDNPEGGGEPQILGSKTLLDVSVTGHINDNLSVTFAVNNLLDTYPDMLRESQVRGEVLWSRRVNQFGSTGRFMNLTLNYNW